MALAVRGGSGRSSVPNPPPPDPRKQGQSSSNKKSVPKTVTAIGGTDVCKKYNDQRGCKGRCPNGKLHVCDIILSNNKAC
eukprot:12404487-Karenia_brevis.AAC.1